MTNRNAIGNKPRGGNRKDGHPTNRARTKAQQEASDAEFLAAGFYYQWLRGAPRLHYTWQGDFPVFEVSPGAVGLRRGLVARHPQSGKEILFAYGTAPGDIAARLDDEILAIMRHDATIDDIPLNWNPEVGPEIDIDEFMEGRWVRS